MERLDKILTGTGRWSRREVKELVKAGRVRVNGAAARSPEEKYDREGLDLRVDGETISGARFVYLMLHKPAGLVSATEDPRQKTVLELLPPHLRRVGLFPAGRLDRDTEGLLLLTNDGALAHGGQRGESDSGGTPAEAGQILDQGHFRGRSHRGHILCTKSLLQYTPFFADLQLTNEKIRAILY